MPTHGKFRYQVGEPFFYYDVRAEVTHNGQVQEYVLADENEILKKHRPFLIVIWRIMNIIRWFIFKKYSIKNIGIKIV